MNPFTWNDKYSLGCPDIDDEHKALFRMAEQLYDAIRNATGQTELTTLFAKLASYTRFHFEDEEALMRGSGYPEYEQHCREHGKLTAKVSMLEWQFRNGHANVDIATVHFLRDWLQHHVCGADQRVADHLKQTRVEECDGDKTRDPSTSSSELKSTTRHRFSQSAKLDRDETASCGMQE